MMVINEWKLAIRLKQKSNYAVPGKPSDLEEWKSILLRCQGIFKPNLAKVAPKDDTSKASRLSQKVIWDKILSAKKQENFEEDCDSDNSS